MINIPKSIAKSVSMATVVRLKRSKGVVIQDCDVYIGRKLHMGGWKLDESKWANPFTVKQCGSAEVAVEKYKEYILSRQDLLGDLNQLQGKVLGCWCKPNICHGDVLVELLELMRDK